MMTEKGRLTYGVEFDGTLHHEFELRLPTVADNIAAIEEVGADKHMALTVSMLARSLVRLGDIPPEAIDTELLNGMVDEDLDVLVLAQDALKKKRRALSAPSATTAPPASSSASTDSPRSAS
jgi:hypothetical protein